MSELFFLMNSGLVSLFFVSLFAATILPLSSEAVLIALYWTGEYAFWPLWMAATLGNVVGAQINWTMGRYCLRFQNHKWFPVSPEAMLRARQRFHAWGQWSLLLAWVPVIGDPLTLIAGAFEIPFIRFSLLVLLGKGGRYLVLLDVSEIWGR